MDGNLILQGDNSQGPASKLFDQPPKPKAIVLLGFHPDGILQDPDTPFFFEVWPLPQDFIFEVCSEPVMYHTLANILSSLRGLSGCQNATSICHA